MKSYFKRYGIFLLVLFIILLSALFAWLFVNPKLNDWPSLFVSSLGSFATIVAIPVAYKIFKSYSATSDVKKKQFQIVEETFTFLISQRMIYNAKGMFVLLFLTSDRVEYLNEANQQSELDTGQRIYVNTTFFEFISELSNKFNQLYFPKSIRGDLLSHLPHAMRMEIPPEESPRIEVRAPAGSADSEIQFGVPFMFPENDMSVKELMDNLIYIKNRLETFLNNHLDSRYHIDS